MLLRIYEIKQGGKFDYYKIVKCQFFLSIPEATAILLSRVVTTDYYLIAYQIAFDILDNENQSFSRRVVEALTVKTDESRERVEKLKIILSGEIRDKLYL